MGLSQLQLNNLSVSKDVDKAFGLLAGFASDHFPTPLLLFICSLEGVVGYGAQWLVVSRRIRPLPYWQMCVFLCMGGNSTTWMNTAVLVTCFRKNRGPVSGILKGYIRLSTAIFTDLCTAIFTDLCTALFSSSSASFLLMLALVPAPVCTIAMPFLRESRPPPPPPTTARARSPASSPLSTPSPSSSPSTSAVRRLRRPRRRPLAGLRRRPPPPPGLAARRPDVRGGEVSRGHLRRRVGPGGPDPRTTSPMILSREEKRAGSEEKGSARADPDAVRTFPVIGEDHTIVEALRTLDFWLLSCPSCAASGRGWRS